MKKSVFAKFRIPLATSLLGFVISLPVAGAVLHVPTHYNTIQAAVDAAASGDEIKIATGVYQQQIVINHKNLTLSGAPGAVIRAWPGMNLAVPPDWAGDGDDVALLTIFSADVTIRGIEFDGQELGDTLDLKGLWYAGAGGSVENCSLHGFRGATSLADGPGIAITAFNYSGFGNTTKNFVVRRCTFSDNGISIFLAGDLSTQVFIRFVIEDNVITGVGPTGIDAQWGIFLRTGVSGTVRHNTISDFYFTGSNPDNPFAIGVLAFDQSGLFTGTFNPLAPISYEANVFVNNQFHLATFFAENSSAVNNSFRGPGLSPLDTALFLSGQDFQVVGNRISGTSRGVVLLGDDPTFGTLFGSASNTKVIANRLCQTTDPIVIEPLAIGTQEDGNKLHDCLERDRRPEDH